LPDIVQQRQKGNNRDKEKIAGIADIWFFSITAIPRDYGDYGDS